MESVFLLRVAHSVGRRNEAAGNKSAGFPRVCTVVSLRVHLQSTEDTGSAYLLAALRIRTAEGSYCGCLIPEVLVPRPPYEKTLITAGGHSEECCTCAQPTQEESSCSPGRTLSELFSSDTQLLCHFSAYHLFSLVRLVRLLQSRARSNSVA